MGKYGGNVWKVKYEKNMDKYGKQHMLTLLPFFRIEQTKNPASIEA
jgi:hypothetical protein